MKKSILISSLLALGITSQTNANSLMCPFTDHFNIGTTNGFVIKELLTDGNISAIAKDIFNFNLSCKSNSNSESGHAYLTVVDSSNNLCDLTILDGPYENNPQVIFINCTGNVKYLGMDHVWGSYVYKLKFINQPFAIS